MWWRGWWRSVHAATRDTAQRLRGYGTILPIAIPIAIGAVALVVGLVIGYQARNPTTTPEYADLAAERDGLADTVAENDVVIKDLNAERGELRGQVQEFDGREEELEERGTELDEREEELDERDDELDAREDELDEREDEITGTEEQLAASTFSGNGTYLVGEDIQPGTYRSEGSDCYWARLSSTDGSFDAIITNNFGSGAQVVTISESDVAFETSGCGEWTPAD